MRRHLQCQWPGLAGRNWNLASGERGVENFFFFYQINLNCPIIRMPRLFSCAKRNFIYIYILKNKIKSTNDRYNKPRWKSVGAVAVVSGQNIVGVPPMWDVRGTHPPLPSFPFAPNFGPTPPVVQHHPSSPPPPPPTPPWILAVSNADSVRLHGSTLSPSVLLSMKCWWFFWRLLGVTMIILFHFLFHLPLIDANVTFLLVNHV